MAVTRNDIVSVCTGNYLHSFPYDHQWSGPVENSLRNDIRVQLNNAKRSRIVSLLAFTIATQSRAEGVLAEYGFVCVSENHNYKYPDTSRYLKTWIRDMNSWEITEAVQAPVNPFRQQAGVTVAAGNQVPVQDNPMPGYTIHNGHVYIEAGRVDGPDVLGYPVAGVRAKAITEDALRHTRRATSGHFRKRGAFAPDPFPLNEWVVLPRIRDTAVPETLRNVETAVLLEHARSQRSIEDRLGMRHPGQHWQWHTSGHRTITHVMRTGPYPNQA